mmetsp:Transcript_120425/g.335997  ORF Transcript_120425/g.335997 Transcript_120425/m.335997 type:complete len:233 (+) Transcript_120425:290-988(+)
MFDCSGCHLLAQGLLVPRACVKRGQALLCHADGHAEACVFHAQWFKQLMIQETVQRLAGDHLDDPSDNVKAIRVEVPFPRVEAQREGGNGLAQLPEAQNLAAVALPDNIRIGSLLCPPWLHAQDRTVAQARTMGEEAPQGEFPLEVLIGVRAAQIALLGTDPDAFELRQVLRQLIVELALAALHQDHQASGHHRLREAVEPHDGIRPHGKPALQVLRPEAAHLQRLIPQDRD